MEQSTQSVEPCECLRKEVKDELWKEGLRVRCDKHNLFGIVTPFGTLLAQRTPFKPLTLLEDN